MADAPITALGTSITGDEGISTGNVVIATFTDADPASTVANFTTGSGLGQVNLGDGSLRDPTAIGAYVKRLTQRRGKLFTVTAAQLLMPTPATTRSP